jgi:sarcosine oxidase gamma subunit
MTGRVVLRVKSRIGRASAVLSAVGLPRPARVASVREILCLGIGPGEWLLVARTADRNVLDELSGVAAAAGACCAEARSQFILELQMSKEQLASLTGLPTDCLVPAACACTRLADIPVTVAAPSGDAFLLLFDRACTQHVRAWLDLAL